MAVQFDNTPTGWTFGALRTDYKTGEAQTYHPIEIRNVIQECNNLVMCGQVFKVYESQATKSGWVIKKIAITDFTRSIFVKFFAKGDEPEKIRSLEKIKSGQWLWVWGSVSRDEFEENENELVLSAHYACEVVGYSALPDREDKAEKKRIEFNLKTVMSGVTSTVQIKDIVNQAIKFGHKGIAITDYSVAYAYPDLYNHVKQLKEKNPELDFKEMYGVQFSMITSDNARYLPMRHFDVERELIFFDFETTGFSVVQHEIIEIGAVKMRKGQVIDKFQTFVRPQFSVITEENYNVHKISMDMVKDAPLLKEVLPEFLTFIGNAPLVAHNAGFDVKFLYAGCQRENYPTPTNEVIDTLPIARQQLPDLSNHKLGTLYTHYFKKPLDKAHRAFEDAEALGQVFYLMLKERPKIREYDVAVYALNETGKKNLYKLISFAHDEGLEDLGEREITEEEDEMLRELEEWEFDDSLDKRELKVVSFRSYKRKKDKEKAKQVKKARKRKEVKPRITKDKLMELREGLLIGSVGEQGEIFQAMLQGREADAVTAITLYDFMDVQPLENYYRTTGFYQATEDEIKQAIGKIIRFGEEKSVPVIATGDVHNLNSQDNFFRKVLVHDDFMHPLVSLKKTPTHHFRTTEEMLNEFAFLGEEKAREIVVDNTRMLWERFESIIIIPDWFRPPKIDGVEDKVREITLQKAYQLYGNPLPKPVQERLDRELQAIIGNGFAVIYYLAYLVVKESNETWGYPVGSRGSVGSSLVATMMGISEVNPLPPHYLCKCTYSDFQVSGVGSGYDLPTKQCPKCGEPMKGEGIFIPFETFMGFKGDKVPDIDQNVSGEIQAEIHNFIRRYLGEKNVVRAGTVGTVQEKYGMLIARKYFKENGFETPRDADLLLYAQRMEGVKRTTGQHAGGLLVTPADEDIEELTPLQYPANDKSKGYKTSHFDFHAIHDNYPKLDILGHTDPTKLKMLGDLTGIDPTTVDISDPKVLALFRPDENGIVRTFGIPEFGTKFAQDMLKKINPQSVADLVKVSGLAHGTGVWQGNADRLMESGLPFSEVIGCRDEIMVYLMEKGLEPSTAFKIMESVRKGKGLTEEWIKMMREHGVPEWYLWSCQQIKYMFPRAHATAYVINALRVAWFKVYHPIAFYATLFSIDANLFEYDAVRAGREAIEAKLSDLRGAKKVTDKIKAIILRLYVEMKERGLRMGSVDINLSEATRFIIHPNEPDKLIPPLVVLKGVGEKVAQMIVDGRKDGYYTSFDDFKNRSNVNTSVIKALATYNAFRSLGLTLGKVDINHSEANEVVLHPDHPHTLLAPLQFVLEGNSKEKDGITRKIIKARKAGLFVSVNDFIQRTGLDKQIAKLFEDHGAFESCNQVSKAAGA